jgi:hypothetical protein
VEWPIYRQVYVGLPLEKEPDRIKVSPRNGRYQRRGWFELPSSDDIWVCAILKQ